VIVPVAPVPVREYVPVALFSVAVNTVVAFAGAKTAAVRINAAMNDLFFKSSSSAAYRGTYTSDCKLKNVT
jgi:hypothetical protein